MIEAGISVGVSEAEFWLMTPRQYWRRLKGEGARIKREDDARTQQAWLGEVLHRVKKVPKLEKLLGNEKPEKVSIAEGFARIREMAKKAREAEKT
jgi:hypothetical protein